MEVILTLLGIDFLLKILFYPINTIYLNTN